MFDRRRLDATLILKGRTRKWLAGMMGMNEATLYRKIKRGGDFSRSEINRILDLLEIEDPAEMKAIFFAPKLA